MGNKLLQLNFSQLESAWKKSKNNLYSDSKKSSYHINLAKLFEKMKDEDFLQLSEKETIERSKVIDFFFHSLTFLDGSTVSQIPFEVIKCLEVALNEWVDEFDKYIIVTSLVKGINAFSFDTRLTVGDDYYVIIESTYGIKFESKLIQINVPESTTRDYLANVALYHELGHFIDRKYRISQSLAIELFKLISSQNSKEILDNHFPFLKNIVIKTWEDFKVYYYLVFSHFSEYFCDLFASQYIDKCLSTYLNYITKSNSDYSQTHPATTNRIKVVNKFLVGETDPLLDLILKTTFSASKRDLRKRFKEFSTNDFENLVPVEIKSAEELHYLFVYGWNLWQSDWADFQKLNKMSYPLTPSQVYEIINNLIEKSIGNYIVKTNWEGYKNVPTN